MLKNSAESESSVKSVGLNCLTAQLMSPCIFRSMSALIREILAGSIMMPAMDAIANPVSCK